MHLDGRHLEFQNGDLFSSKACEAGYYFAINLSLKLVELSILTINICNYLISHEDGHSIQDGRRFLRWPPFLYIKPSLLIKTAYNELISDYCIKFKFFQI